MTESLPKLNLAPAEQALGRIIANPQTHEQKSWRCSTGMCLAGHIGDVLGVTWVNTNPDGVLREYVVSDAEHGLPVRDYLLTRAPDTLAPGVTLDTPIEPIRNYARRMLGLTSREANALFHGDNTREELETGIKALANGHGIGREQRAISTSSRIVELPERRRNEYS